MFKQTPEDFRVDESLDFQVSGAGEHLYLFVEKRNLGTPEVASHLAARFGVTSVAIGYAGMKDKVAVAKQWFSVHTAEDVDICGRSGMDLPGLKLLKTTRHDRKLRRGQLCQNAFTVLLKDVQGDGLSARMELLSRSGVPNYFGPQRFGGDNLRAAENWLQQRRKRRVSAFMKGLYLSVLRAFLFNEVLGRRVQDATWDQPLEGDVLIGGIPAAPLWGRGRSQSRDDALLIENAALGPHQAICEGLEFAGASQQRRVQVLMANSLRWEKSGSELQLQFVLPKGSYATSLLGESFELR